MSASLPSIIRMYLVQKAAPSAVSAAKRKDEDASSSDGGGGDEGEEGESASFEHIEGSYNPKDYAYLNVSTEVIASVDAYAI